MSSDAPRHALEDILASIARVERFVSGMDDGEFCTDDKTRFAVQFALLAISEAGRRLGTQAEALSPDTPWADILGLGHRLRHGDDRINPRVIWRMVHQNLPSLQLAAMVALNRLEDAADQEPE